MTHAERQKAYRKRQGWALKRKNRDRMRLARGTPVRDACVTIGPAVRDARKPVREVQETYTETDDEAWEREHAPRVAPPARMVPEPEVVIPDVIMEQPVDRRAAFEALKRGINNVTLQKPNYAIGLAPETQHQLLEIEME